MVEVAAVAEEGQRHLEAGLADPPQVEAVETVVLVVPVTLAKARAALSQRTATTSKLCGNPVFWEVCFC